MTVMAFGYIKYICTEELTQYTKIAHSSNGLPGRPTLKLVLIELLIIDADEEGNAFCEKELLRRYITNRLTTFAIYSPYVPSIKVNCMSNQKVVDKQSIKCISYIYLV